MSAGDRAVRAYIECLRASADDERVIERYRQPGDQLDRVRAANHYAAMLDEAEHEIEARADAYERHLDAIQDEEIIPPENAAMRREIDRAFDAVLGEGRR